MSDNTEATQTIWEADATHPELALQIREGLRQVMDPELGMNIIELGLIRDASVSETELHLKMILTTPFCPYGPALLEMARVKGEESAELPTTIELGMEMWDPSMMEGGAGEAWGLY
jgi:metal-sulfur cluster biosynthetic enzyme